MLSVVLEVDLEFVFIECIADEGVSFEDVSTCFLIFLFYCPVFYGVFCTWTGTSNPTVVQPLQSSCAGSPHSQLTGTVYEFQSIGVVMAILMFPCLGSYLQKVRWLLTAS